MFASFMRRRTSKTDRPRCSQTLRQRKIVFCDWGYHGRAGNDGWMFTYVDEADFDSDEDLRLYNRTHPDDCGETLSKFVSKQLRKNPGIKESNGWRFVCLIDDSRRRRLPVQRRDRTPRTMLLFEREVPCPCKGREHPIKSPSACSSEELADQKQPSISKREYARSSRQRPPIYRCRPSTLDTVREEDAIYVSHTESA